MNRTFDTTTWGKSIRAKGTDIEIGGHSVLREFARRKDAFYLDFTGLATCQELCPPDLVLPVLATELTAIVAAAPNLLELHIAAVVPVSAAIGDLAFPGAALAGACRRDVALIDSRGHRRTLHTETPTLRPGLPILLALNPVATTAPRRVAAHDGTNLPLRAGAPRTQPPMVDVFDIGSPGGRLAMQT